MLNQSIKIKTLGLIGLIFLIGIVIGFQLGKNNLAVNNYHQNQLTEKVVKDKISQVAYIGKYKVARVIDGDTIEIEGGERVRYIGMDTPETVKPHTAIQCFGPEASQENKKLVAGKIVRLEKDVTNRDKYGRLLRYVWLGNNLVDLTLVQLGFARATPYPPNIHYKTKFYQAENLARKQKIGLWKSCVKNN